MSLSNRASPARLALGLAFLSALFGCLLLPAIFQGKFLSSADLVARSLPWSAGPLEGVEIRGEHSDPVYFFEPWLRFAGQELREGRGLPLRNPLSSLGAPFLANPQSALLSPFTVPYYLFPERIAAWVAAFLKLVVAASGSALLARNLGVSPAGALVAGAGYGLSGFVVLWLTYPLSSALVMLPFALLGVRLLRSRPRTGMALLASSLCAAILGGHPECAFQVGVTTLAWFAFEWSRTPRGERWPFLWRGSLAGVSGGLLAAPQILPFCDYLLSSTALKARTDSSLGGLRMGHPPGLPSPASVVLATAALVVATGLLFAAARIVRRAADRGRASGSGPFLLAVAAGALLAFFVDHSLQAGAWNVFPLLIDPHYYGTSDFAAGADRYCGPVNFNELNGAFVGVGLLLAALLAPALSGARERASWFLYGGFLLCVLISSDAPPFAQALFTIPPFHVTVNRRFLGVAALFAALLAGWAVDGLPRLTRERRQLAGVLAAALGTATLIAVLVIDPGRWPDRTGAEDLPEFLPVPLGAPTAHLTTPSVRSMIRGDEVLLRGFVLSLEPLPDVRVRLTSRADGKRCEVPLDVGLDQPAPRNPTLQQYPRSDSSGFAAELNLAGFSGGDAVLEVVAGSADGKEQVLTRRLVLIVRPRGFLRARWMVPLAAITLLLAAAGPTSGRRFGLVLFLSVSAADVLQFAWQHVPMIEIDHHYPPFAGLERLREAEHARCIAAEGVLPPNTHMAYGLASVGGLDVVDSQDLQRFLNQVRTPRPATPLTATLGFNLENELFPVLGVGRFIVPDTVAVAASEARSLFEGDGIQVLVPAVEPIRARFYPDWVRRLPDQAALDVLRARHVTAADLLVLPPGTLPDPAPSRGAAPAGARLLQDHPGEIRVEVDPGPAGYVLVTDRYSPAFHAEVDGSPARVEAAFDALLAVPLPASETLRTVTLRYRPLPFRIGCWLASAGALVLFLALRSTPSRTASP